MQSFLPLVYGCQSYDWGKIGSDSLVYDLSHKAGIVKEENPQKPFAEIWMGDHPSLPSSLKQRNGNLSSLRDLIEQEPQKFLGKAYSQWGLKRLPFLFKVLSVEKALSLQVHPDKELAKELHERRPDTYKDDNHKPEIAIAINQVEALCNFRPYEDLVHDFEEVGALRDFIGEQAISNFMSCSVEERKEALREIIKEFFKKEENEKNDAINKLIGDISAKEQKTPRDLLVLKIQKQFPYDIGVLMSYLLNYVIAQPGEAFVMDPCEPHAYIFGNILEVMACSDNVVRGCLTPKYIDKELLVKILSCDMKNTTILRGEKLYNHKDHGYEVVKYPTKYEEFWCQRIEIEQKGKETCAFKFEYPSIALVLKGSGVVQVKAPHATTFEEHLIKEGESVFFLPESEIKFNTEEGGFMAYLSTSQSLEKNKPEMYPECPSS